MTANPYPEYKEVKSLCWPVPKHWAAPKVAHLLRLQSGDSITSETIEVGENSLSTVAMDYEVTHISTTVPESTY